MIIAIEEDGGVAVYETIEAIRRDYEGVDVESGAIVFYDSTGQYLVPVFVTPNRHGLFTVRSGEYMLQPGPLPPSADPLPRALHEATHVTASSQPVSLDDLRRQFPYEPSRQTLHLALLRGAPRGGNAVSTAARAAHMTGRLEACGPAGWKPALRDAERAADRPITNFVETPRARSRAKESAPLHSPLLGGDFHLWALVPMFTFRRASHVTTPRVPPVARRNHV